MSCFCFLTPGISSAATSVAIQSAHYKYAQYFVFFLMDLNCWLLFSLAGMKSFYWILCKTCFSIHAFSHLMLYWLSSSATQIFVPSFLFNWEIIFFVQNMDSFEFCTFFGLVHYSWLHFFCQIFFGFWDSTQISVLLSWPYRIVSIKFTFCCWFFMFICVKY